MFQNSKTSSFSCKTIATRESVGLAHRPLFRPARTAIGCIDFTQFLDPLSRSGLFHRRAEGDLVRAGGRTAMSTALPLCRAIRAPVAAVSGESAAIAALVRGILLRSLLDSHATKA